MKAVVFISGIAMGLIATTGFAAACSFCGDPDLVASGPSVGPGVIPAEEAENAGLYTVTREFTGNIVTVSGQETQYTSTSVEVTQPTTKARDVAYAGTGEASFADGTSSNARPLLSDGRAAAGVWVDSYRQDASGNWVWFDRSFLVNDAEVAKEEAKVAAQVVARVEPVAATAIQIPASEPFQPALSVISMDLPEVLPDLRALADEPTGGTSVFGGSGAEGPVDRWIPREPADPATPGGPSMPRPGSGVVRAGVALGPQADVLTEIEVLRGRAVRLWIRATVDGVPARVISWRLDSGDVTALGPIAGSGDDPFIAQWIAVGQADDVFVARFDATVEVSGSTVIAPATILVAVRSPAIVE